MTLEKATKILIKYRKQFHPNTDFDYAQAVSIAIEAVKRIRAIRKAGLSIVSHLLPGETEE